MPRGVAADFQVRLAQTDADVQAAQRLRYDVFVRELGGCLLYTSPSPRD